MKFEFLYHVMGNADGTLVVRSDGPIILAKHLSQPSAVILLRLPEEDGHLILHEELYFIVPATFAHRGKLRSVCSLWERINSIIL